MTIFGRGLNEFGQSVIIASGDNVISGSNVLAYAHVYQSGSTSLTIGVEVDIAFDLESSVTHGFHNNFVNNE